MNTYDTLEILEYDEKLLKEYEKNDFLRYLQVLSFNLVKNASFRNSYYKNKLHVEIIEKIYTIVLKSEHKKTKKNTFYGSIRTSLDESFGAVANSRPFHDKYVPYMRSLRFILSFVNDINNYLPMLLNFLKTDIKNDCKTEILRLIYTRIDEFSLDFNFFYTMLLNLEKIDNSRFSRFKTSNVHVFYIKIMTYLIHNETKIDVRELMCLSKDYTAHMNVELLKLYSKWYFMKIKQKKTEKVLLDYQHICDNDYRSLLIPEKSSEKSPITEDETNLITLVKKSITIEKEYTFFVLTQLARDNAEIQDYIGRSNLSNHMITNFKTNFLSCAYEMSTFCARNREFFQKNLAHKIISLIQRKVEHFTFDNELLDSLKLIKLFSQNTHFLQDEAKNFPVLEICLLALEQDHKNELIDKEVLCILGNITLNHGNSRKIFLENNGFKIIKKRINSYEEEVFSICRNFLYSSTYQEKDAFVREVPLKYVNNVLRRQQLSNINRLFNIYRNLFCCNEEDLVKILKHFGIEEFPRKLVHIAMKYFDFFLNSERIEKNILLNIIYMLVNICILPYKDKNCILNLNFKKVLEMKDNDLNLAIIWLFINVTWNSKEKEIIQKVEEKDIWNIINEIEDVNENLLEKKQTLIDNLMKLQLVE